jgi:hypothetical protein
VAALGVSCERPPEETHDNPLAGGSFRLCARAFECECPGVFLEVGDCASSLHDVLAAESRTVVEAGLIFDPDCLESTITQLELDGCGWDPPVADCGQRCQTYHGTRREGDACRWSGNFHDCTQGLTCDAGTATCVPTCPPPPLRIGEPCSVGMEPSCDWVQDGLICVADEPDGIAGVCAPAPGPDEACDGGQCAPESYCAPTDPPVCRRYAELGEACGEGELCNRERLYCRQSTTTDTPTCANLPSTNETCVDGRCAEGHYCTNDPDNVCLPLKVPDAPCESAEECASQSCVDSRCARYHAPLCDIIARLAHVPSP